MARLEFINFQPWYLNLDESDECLVLDKLRKGVRELPQVYWDDGTDWPEANLWALHKKTADGKKDQTILALMRHMKAYAEYLEQNELDWRSFPMAKELRVLVKFRGYLIGKIKEGDISSSTASGRMSAIIQFYRYCLTNNFVISKSEMWSEKSFSVNWHDTTGFRRSMLRAASDLIIPNRGKTGSVLEDGLMPLSADSVIKLLDYVVRTQTIEVCLVLSLGFFTGARIGTIIGIRWENIYVAQLDPCVEGICLLPVGPKAGVPTKNDVDGHLMIPTQLLSDLKKYCESERRLLRQKLAASENKSLIFLTRRGSKYTVKTVDRLMENLRAAALMAGLEFMNNFKFHQTRATFGTSLMQMALDVLRPSDAIDLTRRAMLHAHEATTFRYVKFIQDAKVKSALANEFTRVFGGVNKLR